MSHFDFYTLYGHNIRYNMFICAMMKDVKSLFACNILSHVTQFK